MVKKRTGIAVYRQIADILTVRIHTGEYQPGERLPSDRDLSEEFGHNRHTVRRALDLLEAQNLIIRHQGRGTFVVQDLPNQKTQLTVGLIDITRELGVRPPAKVLDVSVQSADQVATLLSIQKEAKIIYLHRLRSIGDEPVIVEHIHIPSALTPGLENCDLGLSVRDLMRDEYQIQIIRHEVSFESIPSNSYLSQLLSIPVGFPMMLEKRISYTTEDVPCEYSEHIYRGDRFSFVLK